MFALKLKNTNKQTTDEKKVRSLLLKKQNLTTKNDDFIHQGAKLVRDIEIKKDPNSSMKGVKECYPDNISLQSMFAIREILSLAKRGGKIELDEVVLKKKLAIPSELIKSCRNLVNCILSKKSNPRLIECFVELFEQHEYEHILRALFHGEPVLADSKEIQWRISTFAKLLFRKMLAQEQRERAKEGFSISTEMKNFAIGRCPGGAYIKKSVELAKRLISSTKISNQFEAHAQVTYFKLRRAQQALKRVVVPRLSIELKKVEIELRKVGIAADDPDKLRSILELYAYLIQRCGPSVAAPQLESSKFEKIVSDCIFLCSNPNVELQRLKSMGPGGENLDVHAFASRTERTLSHCRLIPEVAKELSAEFNRLFERLDFITLGFDTPCPLESFPNNDGLFPERAKVAYEYADQYRRRCEALAATGERAFAARLSETELETRDASIFVKTLSTGELYSLFRSCLEEALPFRVVVDPAISNQRSKMIEKLNMFKIKKYGIAESFSV